MHHYLKLAADKGHTNAMLALGLLLEDYDNLNAPQNIEAFQWVKSAANEQDRLALYILGDYYSAGLGVEANEHKAFECYVKSAKLGEAGAINRLGECYSIGIDVEVDDNKAFHCYQEAAERGNPLAQAHLGLSYLYGRGCTQNIQLAFLWLTEAVSSGHPATLMMLESATGLNVSKLIEGYNASCKQTRPQVDGKVFSKSIGISSPPVKMSESRA